MRLRKMPKSSDTANLIAAKIGRERGIEEGYRTVC